jgi:predicted PurR-regulated permease PerM
MERRPRANLGVLLAILLAVAALYFARALLIPLALAMLVTFLLAPLVSRLEGLGLGRVPSVVVLLVMLLGVAGGLGWVAAREAGQLAEDLPEYRTNLRAKIRDLRGPIGSITHATEEINQLGEAIEQPPPGEPPPPQVEVVEPTGMLGALGDLLAKVAIPLGTAGLVAVLALFMLLEREELRDRLLWLLGAQDLMLTTSAVDDAMQRVSRYLGTQSLLNGFHGLMVGIGLLLIGVPGAVMWGAASMLLRFLPYFGPWIAAAGPILLSAAAFPAWTGPLVTCGLFVVLELISNNVLEPWLYGSSAGMSPFAVIFSAVFWTWLWGIPGLLLATPLTVCLVVAGRYVRGLEYFDVLLGDRPALPPHVRLYQRLLASDFAEGADLLASAAEESSLDQVTDRVLLPMLRRLASDDQRDRIPDSLSAAVRERLEELLDDLIEKETPPAADGPLVFFVPALDENEAVAARWLCKLTALRGIPCEVASSSQLVSEVVTQIAEKTPEVVCISALTPRSLAHAQHLRKRMAAAECPGELLIGMWAAPKHELADRPDDAKPRANWIATSAELLEALENARARWRAESS